MNADQINEFGYDTSKIFRILHQMFTKKSLQRIKRPEKPIHRLEFEFNFQLRWTRNSAKKSDLLYSYECSCNLYDGLKNSDKSSKLILSNECS